MISPGRRAAFDVLQRVESGAWADDLLRAAARRLAPRDAALACEIVFGVLRRRMQLDFLIGFYSGREARLDAEVRTALRMGIYQLRFLDRVPAHAAVSESVALVRRAGKSSAAGFVNAVLRKVDRGDIAWPDRATALSMPPWLLERWERRFGAEAAAKIAAAALEPPPSFWRGARQQDIGAQSIVPLLELGPGLTFLDVCAAPGNKTAQALEAGVRAVACDLHPGRLKSVEGCPRVALDATRPLPFSRRFDRILVDAPCTGTGTLGRNPEIKWKLTPGDLADLHARQVCILRHAVAQLAPGGRLVYSTCSLEREENEEVVEEALPGLAVETHLRLPGIEPGDGFFAAVIPSK